MKRLICTITLALCALGLCAQQSHEFSIGKKTYSYSIDLSDASNITMQVSRLKGKKWKPEGEPLSLGNPAGESRGLKEGSVATSIVFEAGTYAVFSYWSNPGTYTILATDLAGADIHALTFSGTPGKSVIEGWSDYSVQEPCPVLDSLKSILSADKQFKEISEADYLTDRSVSWWFRHNREAQTKATSLAIGTVPERSSLVQGFKASDASDENAGWKAAVYEIRGYTVVVAYSKTTGSYSLVWAEPECRNKATDRYLRNIYFESSNTVALFFTKGKTTFKYRINLASKSIKR